MKHYQASVRTPFAHLGIRVIDDKLAAIDFIDDCAEIRPVDKTSASICSWIRRYLRNSSADPSEIACTMTGTPFQQKVWNELKTIPAGKVVTYGELADRLGTSARAVGNACRRNPVPLVVPCHRVVSANGMGGYAGETGGELLRIKAWLLHHEGCGVN